MRFVRRRNSSKRGRDKSAVLIASVLSAILAATFAASAIRTAIAPLGVVDPLLVDELRNGGSAWAYIVAHGSSPICGVKTWKFGGIVVTKAKIAKVDLDFALRDPHVVSVWAAHRFSHPDAKVRPSWLSYDFRDVDIKWKVHKRTLNWIGRNVTVCIIDTGIDYTHPDFYDAENRTIIRVLVSTVVEENGEKPLVWIPYVNGSMSDLLAFDMSIYERINETAFLDLNGHGTHVAGIIAGRGWASNGKYRGLAPGAYLVIVRAFDKNGYAQMDAILDALQWVYDNVEKWDIRVLSLSWGAMIASDGTDPVSVACDQIAKRGVFVFAAAGNAGNWPSTVMVPAVARYVYAVGAWDGYVEKIAPFSSIGPTIDMRMKPDFLGAGVMVVSCKSNFTSFPSELEVGKYYVALSGTSMATPCVAAVCADFIEYWMYWHHEAPTRAEWEHFAVENAARIDPLKDFVSGWGIPQSP